VQPESNIVYSKQLKKYHRFLFSAKVNYLYEDLINKVDISLHDITYATTLFSDGYVANKLFQNFEIPYIIAVRNTDIHIFLKYRPDLKNLALEILSDASQIIFISQSNFDNFYSHRFFKNK